MFPSPVPKVPEEVAPVDRRLVRVVWAGLAFLFCVAIVGPLISFRSDVANSRIQGRARIMREAAIFSETLKIDLETRVAELERVAHRPEVDLADGNQAPERTLLALSHGSSALFSGVAFLGTQGAVVWAEPSDGRWKNTFGREPWFQRLLAAGEPVVDLFSPATDTVAAAVPVLRQGVLTGALLGLIDISHHLVPPELLPAETIILLDDRARMLDVSGHVAHLTEPLRRAILAAQSVDAPIFLEGDPRAIAVLAPIEGTRLFAVFLGNEEATISSMRGRLFDQLLFLASLQVASVLLFSLLLRHGYQRARVMESKFAEDLKMVALGQASALIAHEVKNSLNGLNAAAQQLGAFASGGSEAEPVVRILKGQVQRLEHVARSLLDFARPNAPRILDFDLERVVRDALEALALLPESETVTIDVSLEPGLRVRGDPLLLLTAIDNLVRNAIEAGAVARDLGKNDAPFVRVRARHEKGEIVVEVEDDAGGPAPDFEQKMFRPFATSKPKGIGLGLTMALQSVESQGGGLEFERTRFGSRFIVRLAGAPRTS